MTTILDGVMFVDGSLASQSVLLAGSAELILRGQDALVADQPTATVGSASLTNLQTRSTGVEASIDMPAIVTDSGAWVSGLALGVTDLNARFAVDGGTARISGTGLSLTGAATWYGQRGAYVDVQGRISRITADLRASATELAEGESLTGQAASIEVGQEIVIGQGQSVLPHLRLGHARLSGDAFADSTGMLVDPGTHRSTNARIGATWQQTLDAGGAVFVTGHLDHDFNPVTPHQR
ncbi:MAG: autotransporter outer membrane beta-barrel domain-containing protein [Loktanella sp.]|nr:autotransporter outer membrane beta-barrel domain-containing protein [Loktanella sp.]